MIIRLVAKALDVLLKAVAPSFCGEALTAVASELEMTASELDRAIWNYQRSR